MNKKLVIALIVSLLFLVGCGSNSIDHTGEAKTPSESRIQKGKDYTEVIEDFEKQGFTNIKTQKLDDLITGWLTKDGEVESVSVDGDTDYSPDVWYPNDVEVIITYHTFPEKDAKSETTVSEGEVSDKKIETKNDKDSENIEEKEDIEDSEKIEEKTDPEVDKTTNTENNSEENNETKEEVKSQSILTIDNSEALNELLNTENSDVLKKFVSDYKGKKIQFNGNIANVVNHNNYKTRFDFLVYAGDYSTSSSRGPAFQFKDKNYNDLNLIGKNIPDEVREGQNYIITAEVLEYNPTNGLFFLKPITLEYRD